MRKQMDDGEIARLPEKTVGQRLKKLRLSAKMTQDQFSEKLGFSTNYYGQVERDAKELSKNMANEVCKYFDTSYSYLYQGIIPGQIGETSAYDTCKNHIVTLTESCTNEECQLLYSFLRLMIQDYRRRRMDLLAHQKNAKKRPGRPRKNSVKAEQE